MLELTSRLAFVATLVACGAEAPAEPAPTPAPPETPVAEEVPAIEDEPSEPPPVVASTHEVLVLVVHEEPLLPSELRLLEVLEARLGRRTDLELREASADEAALAEAHWASSDAIPPAPETFGRASRVLFLRVPAPRRLSDGNRATRGFSGALLLRPPTAEPAISVAIDEVSSWRATDDRWASWLSGLLREPEAT